MLTGLEKLALEEIIDLELPAEKVDDSTYKLPTKEVDEEYFDDKVTHICKTNEEDACTLKETISFPLCK